MRKRLAKKIVEGKSTKRWPTSARITAKIIYLNWMKDRYNVAYVGLGTWFIKPTLEQFLDAQIELVFDAAETV